MLYLGDEEKRVVFCYSPVFPENLAILDFCLINNIYLDLKKIDYLNGDLKEEPLLVDGRVTCNDRSVLICYYIF
jgi:hypothetical protein